jgi:hypothetical protein
MKVNNMIDTKLADSVLKEFKKLARISESTREMDIYSYTNGREQGYTLNESFGNNQRKVAFAEYRKSDDIVVYFGQRTDFERNTNIPSEAVYESMKLFDYNKPDQAAEFIFDYLTGV